MALAVVLAEVRAARALGRLLRAWYVLLSSSWTSTRRALSSIFFSSWSSWEPEEGHYIIVDSEYQEVWKVRLDVREDKSAQKGEKPKVTNKKHHYFRHLNKMEERNSLWDEPVCV